MSGRGLVPASGDRGRREPPAAAGRESFFFEGVESPNGTIFPDVLIDRVMPHLSGAEFKVLAYIVRRTFGFKKESDAISLDQICNGIVRRDGSVLDEGTGLARKTAVAAIQGLEGKGVILCQRRSSPEKGNLPTTYALRFRGQSTTAPGANSHPGSSEMYPPGGANDHQPGHLALLAPGTALHSQLTVGQPTAQQGEDVAPVRPASPPATLPIATTDGLPLAEIWTAVLARLAAQLPAATYRTWLAPAELTELTAETATVAVPHAVAQRWIGRHLQEAIGAALAAVCNGVREVRLVVASASNPVAPAASGDLPQASAAAARPAPPALPRSLPEFSRRGGVIRRVRRPAAH